MAGGPAVYCAGDEASQSTVGGTATVPSPGVNGAVARQTKTLAVSGCWEPSPLGAIGMVKVLAVSAAPSGRVGSNFTYVRESSTPPVTPMWSVRLLFALFTVRGTHAG